MKLKDFLNQKKDGNWEKHHLVLLNKKNVNFVKIGNELAEFYILNGRYEEAVLIYEKMFSMFNEGRAKNNILWNALCGLGFVSEKQGYFNLAIEYIKRAEGIRNYFSFQESYTYFEKVCLTLSRCYLKIGDKQKALNCLKDYCDKDEKLQAISIKQLGEVYLDFFDYIEAEKCFKKSEIEILNITSRIEVDYFLCMALLGKKDYDSIFKIANKEDFFRSSNDTLVFGFFSSAIVDVKKKRFKEAKEKFDKILNIITFRLNCEDFYKFYYYNFLLYYGLGNLNVAQKQYDEAKINFRKILEIIEMISPSRYEYFLEKVNIYFFKFLASFELVTMENNSSKRTKDIKILKESLKKLSEEERFLIGLKEIGNSGSIIKKINNLK